LCDCWDLHCNACEDGVWLEMRQAIRDQNGNDSQETVEFPMESTHKEEQQSVKPSFINEPQELMSSKKAGPCSVCISGDDTDVVSSGYHLLTSVSLPIEMVQLRRLPKNNTHRLECCTLTEGSSINNVIFFRTLPS
jgi:hypothetical protein